MRLVVMSNVKAYTPTDCDSQPGESYLPRRLYRTTVRTSTGAEHDFNIEAYGFMDATSKTFHLMIENKLIGDDGFLPIHGEVIGVRRVYETKILSLVVAEFCRTARHEKEIAEELEQDEAVEREFFMGEPPNEPLPRCASPEYIFNAEVVS